MASIPAFYRLLCAAYVLTREGVLSGIEINQVPVSARLPLKIAGLLARKRVAADRATRISDALNALGPSYIKLGQFLATRPDLVGQHVARDLEKLQDSLEPFDMETVQDVIIASFGRPTDAIFKTFSEPVAAASIAQVHRATIEDEWGKRDVAVKILRPALRQRFARDLESFYLAARLIEKFHPPSRRLRSVAIVDILAQTVKYEMDLRLEAAALSEMADNTSNDPSFRLPKVEWSLTGHDILTTEWIDGIKLNNRQALEAAGIDPIHMADTAIQSFLRHAMRDGFFHADMHPGNLFVDSQGNLCAVDLGIMGRLNEKERRFLAEILYGFITRNYRRVAEVHFQAGYVPYSQDVDYFAQALRAIGEPLQGRTADQISMGHLLTQLFEVTEIFNMYTQPRLILLQKTMVVVEGVARQLNPHLDIWKTAEPVVREWIAQHLGPSGQLGDAAGSLSAFARLILDAPDHLHRLERISEGLSLMSEQGIKLDHASAIEIARAEFRYKRYNRIALWIGVIALTVIAIQSIMN